MTFSALCDQHDHQPPGVGRHPAAQGAVAPKAFKMVTKGQEIFNSSKKTYDFFPDFCPSL